MRRSIVLTAFCVLATVALFWLPANADSGLFQAQGVDDIDLMMASHGDSDHIGGLIKVLEAMPVTAAWLDSQTCTTLTLARAPV